jgi:hypothetical protein
MLPLPAAARPAASAACQPSSYAALSFVSVPGEAGAARAALVEPVGANDAAGAVIRSCSPLTFVDVLAEPGRPALPGPAEMDVAGTRVLLLPGSTFCTTLEAAAISLGEIWLAAAAWDALPRVSRKNVAAPTRATRARAGFPRRSLMM